MKSPKIYLCAFGNLNLSVAAYRFYHQALSMGIFENIFIYNECNLDLDFVREFRDRFYEVVKLPQSFSAPAGGGELTSDSFGGGRYDPFFMGEKIVRVTRGFGYWCWKPQVILQSLRQINEGDILIYADIGCEFVPSKAKSLLEKLKELEHNDIMGFACGGLPEKHWTKGDVFRYFGVENDPRFTESTQIAGGFVFMKKSPKTLEIINEWLFVFKNHYNLVDDSPSQTPNHKDFRENRHDQSIWGMINKKHRLKNFHYSGDDDLGEFGILVSRKSHNTMGLMFDTNGRFRLGKYKIIRALLKIGSKISFNRNTRKQCRSLHFLSQPK